MSTFAERAKLAFATIAVPLIFPPCTISAQDLDSRRDTSETWSYHFQYTGIEQIHGSFAAQYSGRNSLRNDRESSFSVTTTLFVGRKLWTGGEVYLDPEMSGGSGFSSTTGIAGFPNGEIYRVDDAAPKVTLARAFIRQYLSLGGADFEKIESEQNQLAGLVPQSRITLTIGRFSLTDIFDDNAFSHDPRTQFMNWAIWTAGSWDYAADTRGYDWGIATEIRRPEYRLNLAAVMVPAVANGLQFDSRITKAYSLNIELVKSYRIIGQDGKLHLIYFLNHAHMGNYRKAVDEALTSGLTPEITKTREYCSKYGFVVGIEQPLSETAGLFSRFSWNDGTTETWTYTEIDRSFLIGLNFQGDSWKRRGDIVGIAFAVNALSNDHRNYLASGGYGFMIGDGRLNYGLEQIAELFYSFKVSASFSLTLDEQLIVNPAYNKDRGPYVNVTSVRGHIEL